MAAQDRRTALSVVVVSFSPPTSLERCLASLVDQATAPDVEIVVVRATRTGDSACETVQQRFSSCRWLPAPVGETVPRMRAQGIAAAQGDVIALLEDDCVLDGHWCAAVLEAHRERWVAVGGAVEPGPYTRALDWAVYLYEYGRFMLPFEAHPSAVLPGNNVSYKREVLRDEVVSGGAGFYEVFVHDAWRRQGLPMLLTPTVVVTNRHSRQLRHVSIGPFHHGRGFAAMRVQGQCWLRRGALALIAPLLPFLQISRMIRLTIRRNRLRRRSALALPWLCVFAASWALGEAVGYLLGPGNSLQHWR
jgi:hypothetical protein